MHDVHVEVSWICEVGHIKPNSLEIVDRFKGVSLVNQLSLDQKHQSIKLFKDVIIRLVDGIDDRVTLPCIVGQNIYNQKGSETIETGGGLV